MGAYVRSGQAHKRQEHTVKRILRFIKIGFGGMLPPKHDLRRWVKWPRYIRIQRQRASLWMRLRVPPAINQFTYTLERNQAYNLYKLLMKYRPESKKEKKERLQKEAEERAKGMEVIFWFKRSIMMTV